MAIADDDVDFNDLCSPFVDEFNHYQNLTLYHKGYKMYLKIHLNLAIVLADTPQRNQCVCQKSHNHSLPCIHCCINRDDFLTETEPTNERTVAAMQKLRDIASRYSQKDITNLEKASGLSFAREPILYQIGGGGEWHCNDEVTVGAAITSIVSSGIIKNRRKKDRIVKGFSAQEAVDRLILLEGLSRSASSHLIEFMLHLNIIHCECPASSRKMYWVFECDSSVYVKRSEIDLCGRLNKALLDEVIKVLLAESKVTFSTIFNYHNGFADEPADDLYSWLPEELLFYLGQYSKSIFLGKQWSFSDDSLEVCASILWTAEEAVPLKKVFMALASICSGIQRNGFDVLDFSLAIVHWFVENPLHLTEKQWFAIAFWLKRHLIINSQQNSVHDPVSPLPHAKKDVGDFVDNSSIICELFHLELQGLCKAEALALLKSMSKCNLNHLQNRLTDFNYALIERPRLPCLSHHKSYQADEILTLVHVGSEPWKGLVSQEHLSSLDQHFGYLRILLAYEISREQIDSALSLFLKWRANIAVLYPGEFNNRPNVHAALHMFYSARIFGPPRSIWGKIVERKHRVFRILSAHYKSRDVAFFILRREVLLQSIRIFFPDVALVLPSELDLQNLSMPFSVDDK